jgi:periplasmic protein CpxP/Spy
MKHPIATFVLLSLISQGPVFGAESATTGNAGMQRMQDMMEQINKEPDEAKRRELMKEHMEAMHSHMMTQQEDASSPAMSMDDRVKRMEQRMAMMEMMMGEMMQHESAELESPAHDHEP